jgi:hypothetical protein
MAQELAVLVLILTSMLEVLVSEAVLLVMEAVLLVMEAVLLEELVLVDSCSTV